MSGFYEFFAGGGMVRAGLGPGGGSLHRGHLTKRKESYAKAR